MTRTRGWTRREAASLRGCDRRPRTRSAVAALALGASVALGACKATTDLGSTCTLTTPCSSSTCAVTPDKVSNTSVDYIALGSAVCDNLVCIRTAGSANPDNTASEARGYCTNSCTDNSDCSPDYQGNGDKLVCQRLLLDQAFLDALKQSNPTEYEQVFGNGASSTYCILPSSVSR